MECDHELKVRKTSASSNNVAPTPTEYSFKVLVIGDVGTGKTSIVKRYVHNLFSQHYQATIGVDFAMKTLRWDDNLMRMQLWDIAGQERFGVMTRVYYKESSGAVVVFDISKANGLDGVVRWKKDLDAKCRLKNGRPIPAIVLANKCDLEKYCGFRDKDNMDQFCAKHGFVGWFQTSAKENTGIDDAMRHLVNHMITIQAAGDFEIPVVEGDQSAIKLTSFPAANFGGESRCCRL